jgi:hypothetical protein
MNPIEEKRKKKLSSADKQEMCKLAKKHKILIKKI